jgi:hypothetical protein
MRRRQVTLLGAVLIGAAIHEAAAPVAQAYNWRLLRPMPTNSERLAELTKSLAELTERIVKPAEAEQIGAKQIRKIPKEKRGPAYYDLEVRKMRALTLEEIARLTPDDDAKIKKWGAAVQEWVGISECFTQKLQAAGPGHNLFSELWFEAKRCSVKAYENMGIRATRGDQAALTEKYSKFARDFDEFSKKNKDLPESLKQNLKKLIDQTPLLKQESGKLMSGK